MTSDISVCSPGTNAAAAAEIMWTRNCGSLPIVEDGRGVIGMVTDRDLLIALGTSNRTAAELLVGEVMSRELSFCAPGDDLCDALKIMAQKQLHRLPVVDKDGELKGILSLNDIVLQAGSNGIAKELLQTMQAIGEHQNQNAAAVVSKKPKKKAAVVVSKDPEKAQKRGRK
jgi:CBS-domain-containing membrane protein